MRIPRIIHTPHHLVQPVPELLGDVEPRVPGLTHIVAGVAAGVQEGRDHRLCVNKAVADKDLYNYYKESA